ncbi:hypothetical protein HIM_11561 [Hirsutella minnesotensis 3608]|uniref:Uncharacterized protein n=1 Tax=Hirsutella minnesotensis 3608 TaxID=1043627 RepID=A0A0F7ZIY6_9HYPO|nr:hypothetical protein HIM_11561 [Hirsutella minnesotensis 3608]
MAPASGSHADPDALKQGNRSPPDSAVPQFQLRPSYPTEARRNDSAFAAQQLAQLIPSTETPEAAVTEGAQLDDASNLVEPQINAEYAPVSILEAATKVARDQTAAHNAKLAVLRAFSEAFERVAKQFKSDTENKIAKQLATQFLDFWTHSLTEFDGPQRPTYSSVAASGRKPQGQLACKGFTADLPDPVTRLTYTRIELRH